VLSLCAKERAAVAAGKAPEGVPGATGIRSPDAPPVLTGPLAMASRAGEELLTDCSIACVAVAPSIGSRALVSCCPCAPRSASPLLLARPPKGFLARPESAPQMLRPCSPSRSPSRRGRVPSCSPSAPSYVSPLLHRLCHAASCGAPLLRYRALRSCCRCARRGLRCARRACSPAAASRLASRFVSGSGAARGACAICSRTCSSSAAGMVPRLLIFCAL